MKKIIICFLIIFNTSAIIFSQSRKIEKLKIDYIESALLKFDNNKLPVIKWENKDTLNYHIYGEFKFMSKKSWEKYLNDLESLINIKIIETKNISESDIKIYFGELNDYFNAYNINIPRNVISSNFDNWNNRKYNNKKQLTSTSYCIVTSKTKDSKRGSFNLKKLFLNSLGLLGELESDYSLFNKNQTDTNTQLNKNDKRIIKIHYNDLVKAGMTLDEIKNVLKSIDLESILKEKY